MTKASAKTAGSDEAAGKPVGRYRKVEVRTWGDEKFRALSPIPACGQGLWLYLITGPHTGPIPGLFRAGRAGMAEELGWELEAFDEAFGEVSGQGMVKADFKARVMWIPNAIRCNRPESPNVVKSWAAEFDLIPECDLKREAYTGLREALLLVGEPFVRAFDEAIRKPSAKTSAKAMANQEQEQEQQQKKDKDKDKDPQTSVGTGPHAPAAPAAAADASATQRGQGPAPAEDDAAAARATRKPPKGFIVSYGMREWAVENAPLVDVDEQTATFKDHTFKVSISDWAGAWRNWMRKAQGFAVERGARSPRVAAAPTDDDVLRHAGLPPAGEVIEMEPTHP